SAIVREWLLYNCPQVLETPAQSLSLNVIKYVWHESEVRIRQNHITNKDQLKKGLLMV
ncbi:hypothetical protein WH47_05436, partial [Habropoda laboriosa]